MEIKYKSGHEKSDMRLGHDGTEGSGIGVNSHRQYGATDEPVCCPLNLI